MNQRVTLCLGFFLLLIGGIIFLGCSDTAGKSSVGTPELVTADLPAPVQPTAAEITSSTVQTTSGTTAVAMLTPFTVTPPSGEQLSVPAGSVITFSGNNVSATSDTLPLIQIGNTLESVGTAVFAPGQVTMSFPVLTMGQAGTVLSLAATKSRSVPIPPFQLVIDSLSIKFTVNADGSWTAPTSAIFQPMALPDGNFVLGSQFAQVFFAAGTAPSAGTLSVSLYNNDTYMADAVQTSNSASNEIDFKGHRLTDEFNNANVMLDVR
jgi:hypothetical protein